MRDFLCCVSSMWGFLCCMSSCHQDLILYAVCVCDFLCCVSSMCEFLCCMSLCHQGVILNAVCHDSSLFGVLSHECVITWALCDHFLLWFIAARSQPRNLWTSCSAETFCFRETSGRGHTCAWKHYMGVINCVEGYIFRWRVHLPCADVQELLPG